MKKLFAVLSILVITGCGTTDRISVINPNAVYRLGSDTTIDNVLFQTSDGEWIRYPNKVTFPAGFYIGMGPEED